MKRRGFTLVDLLVSLACILLLASLLLSCGRDPGNVMIDDHQAAVLQSRIIKDKSNLKAIHMAVSMCSSDHNGSLPRPSHTARLPVMFNGEDVIVPGVGDPDWSKNTSANFYSSLVAQMYCEPDMLVSPIEHSPVVYVMDDYDHRAFNPAEGSWWDENFRCDLTSNGRGSNTSYAHIGLSGNRGRRTIEQMKYNEPMFSYRGPGGLPGSREFNASPTLEFMDPHQLWNANIVYSDGSVVLVSSPMFEAGGRSDPIFLTDDPSGDDVWLGIFTASTENGATPSFDPLMN